MGKHSFKNHTPNRGVIDEESTPGLGSIVIPSDMTREWFIEQLLQLREWSIGRTDNRIRTGHLDFLLKHGRLWKRQTNKPTHRKGTCYQSSRMVTMVNPQLTYVEGVSFFPHTRLIGAHAWCVDPEGYVVDPTDTLPSYLGVPLNVAWIAKTLERAGTAASALRFLFENGETVRGDFLDARWAEWKLGTLQRRFRTLGA